MSTGLGTGVGGEYAGPVGVGFEVGIVYINDKEGIVYSNAGPYGLKALRTESTRTSEASHKCTGLSGRVNASRFGATISC